MWSRYFKLNSGKSSKKKWEKEISLTAEDKDNPDGYTLKVKKCLLMEHSGVFKSMPENELKKCKKMKLEEVTVTALQKIMEFMVKSTATFLNHNEALETLKAAHRYEITAMMDICTNHLVTALEITNVCDLYEVASSLSLPLLEYPCLKMIDQNAEDVLKSRGFMTLKKPTVLHIIKRNSLGIHSELNVFEAVLAWGLNDSLRRGLDPDNIETFLPIVRHLFNHVRFSALSEEELGYPEVVRYYTSLSSSELWSRVRSLSVASESSSGSVDLEHLPRQFVDHYSHHLGAHESQNQRTVKNGETFCLNFEILKGRVFLTSLKLAFRAFAATKSSACLCVVLTATNVMTMEQRTTRGTFLNTTDEASVEFASPITARESERIHVALCVKRAENICPFTVSRDVQIAMPESKAVALKISPLGATSEAEEIGRCIFKEIQYFF